MLPWARSFTIPMKRTGTVLVRNDSRYNGARKRSRLTPLTYTKRTSNRTEVKNAYGNTDAFAVTTTGVVIRYGFVDQGADEHERIGKAITSLGQEQRWRFDRAPGISYGCMRIITGIWKQNYLPAALDVDAILESGTNAGPKMVSPFVAENSKNYVILGDEYINTDAQAAGGTLTGGTGTIDPNPSSFYIKRKYNYKAIQEYQTASGEASNWCHFILCVADADVKMTAELQWNVVYTDN